MVRKPYVDKDGLKKGAWSPEEDNKLIAFIQRYGNWNWRKLPKYAGLTRCGKSCRLRWINYLKPNIKLGNYTKEEEDLIIKLYQQLGSRWSQIAAKLPGRTDNEIKNYWHTHLKKRVQQHETMARRKHRKKTLTKKYSQSQQKQQQINYSSNKTHPSVQILESSHVSPQLSNAELSNLSTETPSINNNDNHICDLTTLISNLSGTVMSTGMGTDTEESTMSSYDAIGEVADGSFWNEPFVFDTCQPYDDLQLDFCDGVLMSPPSMSFWEDMDFVVPSIIGI